MMKFDFNKMANQPVQSFVLDSWADAIVNADVEAAKELMAAYELHPDTPINEEGDRPLIWLLENSIEFLEEQQVKLLLALTQEGADIYSPVSPGLCPLELALISTNDKAASAVAGRILLNNFETGQPVFPKNPLERIFVLSFDRAERYELLGRIKHNHDCIRKTLMNDCMDQDEMKMAVQYFNMAFWLDPFPVVDAQTLPQPSVRTSKLLAEFAKKSVKAMHSMSGEEFDAWEQQAEGAIAVSRAHDLQRLGRKP